MSQTGSEAHAAQRPELGLWHRGEFLHFNLMLNCAFHQKKQGLKKLTDLIVIQLKKLT